jgi:glucan-binding YG repeat protein
MGTTGNSSGVHLHYQINNSTNTPIDPTILLGIPNQKGSYNSKDYILNGWRQDNNGWRFYQNNSYLTNKWIEDSQGWCYVGKDGYALTNSWSKDSQGWCYLDKEGHAIKSKWK